MEQSTKYASASMNNSIRSDSSQTEQQQDCLSWQIWEFKWHAILKCLLNIKILIPVLLVTTRHVIAVIKSWLMKIEQELDDLWSTPYNEPGTK